MNEKTRNTALVVAALTCPCHVVLLPVLAAGTAVGAGLQAHLGWFVGGATMVFLSALGVTFWQPKERVDDWCDDGRCGTRRADRTRSNKQTHAREETVDGRVTAHRR